MVIQEEKYQVVYDIHDMGPNNYDLGVKLTYPNSDRHLYVSFGSTNKDGADIWLDVLLTELKSLNFEREQWKFEGILWSWELHTKKEAGGRTRRARVKGVYNSRTRIGKLYVLAHEQPKPLVEALSWEEVKQRTKEGECVIEFKHRKNGTIKRARLTGVELNENLLAVKRVDLKNSGYVWAGIGSGADSVEIEKCSQPLALADGRIIFTADGIDYTIYLPDSGYIMTALC